MSPGLAIEASGPRAAVAVFGDDGAVLAVREQAAALAHARVLLTLADEAMKEAGVRPADLGGIAIDVGPGSFTALRVSLATAHGLAQPHHRPIVGVTVFAALVDGVNAPRRLLVPLVPAGRALLYAGFIRSGPLGDQSLLRGPAVGDLATIAGCVGEALALCPKGVTPLFLGPGAARERAGLESFFPGSTGLDADVAGAAGPDVAAVARVGQHLLQFGARPFPLGGALRPLYVRAPQALESLPAARPSWAQLELAPFAESDLDEVLAVEQAVFSDPWPRQFFLDEIRHPGSLAAVVRHRGILAGYLLAWRLESEMHLGNLAVATGHQRRGIGRFLIDWLVRQADAGGQERITLEVRASNFAAQELYRRFDFRAVALRRGYYQDTGEDALVMMRDRGAPTVEGTS